MIPEASTEAARVDAIFVALCIASGIVVMLLLALIMGFSLVYRRGSKAKRKPLRALVAREVEISWTVATLFAFLFAFWWATSAQINGLKAPANAMEIHVVAKQWMWKFQHPNGTREINELHLPQGSAIRLIMISQDVIHSFYVPAFRLKQDVLPGRYAELWFVATEPGIYRVHCAEFCGTDHASMTGRIIVMNRSDYSQWLAQRAPQNDLAAQGELLFGRLGCAGCHGAGSVVRAPDLTGVAGRNVPLAHGGFRRADGAYLRDAIVLPNRDVVAGYAAEMPSYQDEASEEEINALVAYLQSLGVEAAQP